jgi:glycosyltransferase involved in cell wall biosynthesis
MSLSSSQLFGVQTASGPAPAAVLFAHPSAELYGADRVFLESVSAAVETGAHVTVTLPVAGPLVRVLEARGALVVLSPSAVLQKSALRPRGFLRLLALGVRSARPGWRLARRAGADGVYVSTITVPAWLILGRLARRRVIVHVHEAETNAPRVVKRLLAAPVWLAHTVVVNSRFSLDTLVARTSRLRRRSVVLYNGVPGPPAVTPARASLEGPVQMLYIGRLSPRKGPQFALQVLADLVGRGVDARLKLLGSVYPGYEWFEDELRASAHEPELAGRVGFMGFQDDVWPIFAEADVVLIPSLIDEPFGNTAVEAILAARPVIASDTSGLREAAGGYGSAQLVAPGAIGAWADAVEKVIDDWFGFAAAAAEDATIARERHSVSTYRRRLAEIVGLRPMTSGGADRVGAL